MDFLVDHREPAAIQGPLVALGAEVAVLERGDVVVGPWVVERKRASDLVASLCDGRLLTQAARLRETGLRPILVVEGPFAREDLSDALHASCMGALASVAGTHAIPVVPTPDEAGTVAFLQSLRRRRAPAEFEVKEPVVKLRRLDPYVAMLAQVPGVGAKRAQAFAERFPSFASLGRLRYYEMVDAFGPKTATTLWRLLKGRDVPDVYRRLGTGKRARRLVDANPRLEDERPPATTLEDALRRSDVS